MTAQISEPGEPVIIQHIAPGQRHAIQLNRQIIEPILANSIYGNLLQFMLADRAKNITGADVTRQLFGIESTPASIISLIEALEAYGEQFVHELLDTLCDFATN